MGKQVKTTQTRKVTNTVRKGNTGPVPQPRGTTMKAKTARGKRTM